MWSILILLKGSGPICLAYSSVYVYIYIYTIYIINDQRTIENKQGTFIFMLILAAL